MILVIDLEATCANDGSIEPHAMEIIEVGAVWATFEGTVRDVLQRFVRPIENPCLTTFCIELTHIQQAEIDTASDWKIVAAELAGFASRFRGQYWGSWGNYDARQIELECAKHRIASPLTALEHINLKAQFSKVRRIKQVGMATALKIAALELEGERHRALSDAQNIARLLPFTSLPSRHE